MAMAHSMINGLDAIAKLICSLILSRRPAATDDSRHAVMIDAGRNINSSYQTRPGRYKSTNQTPSNDNSVRRLYQLQHHHSIELCFKLALAYH
jgi:hypothetical protein